MSSFLALQPWVTLSQEHKNSPVASILCEVTSVVHPKCRQVPMYLVLPMDAWTSMLPLSIQVSSRGSFSLEHRPPCLRHHLTNAFVGFLCTYIHVARDLIQFMIPSSALLFAHADVPRMLGNGKRLIEPYICLSREGSAL